MTYNGKEVVGICLDDIPVSVDQALFRKAVKENSIYKRFIETARDARDSDYVLYRPYIIITSL